MKSNGLRLYATWMFSLLMVSCGASRTHIEPLPAGCKVKVLANGVIPGKTPDKVVDGPTPGRFGCLTAQGTAQVAAQEACAGNYQGVSLINIIPAGYFSGPCYRADFAFYSQSKGMIRSDEPIVQLDSQTVEGWEFLLESQFGGVLSGPQNESGLVSEGGDTATTSKFGFMLGSRYFFNSVLGVDLGFGRVSTSATAPQTKAMDLLDSWNTDVGIAVVPLQVNTLTGIWHLMMFGGMNYTSLTFADDYKEFMAQNHQTQITGSSASGIGWYSGFEIRQQQRNRFTWGLGLRYRHESPRFDSGTEAFSANSLFFAMSVGYKP